MGLTLAIGGSLLALSFVIVAFIFRRVVPTNEVHIVQTRNRTIDYGKDMPNGNVYYQWPSFLPILGVERIVLPVSVFDVDLLGYEAYDKGRLPFVVDVKAFFRISEPSTAAQRVASFDELRDQLESVVQGAVRTILATNEIEEIMQGRSKFSDEFTKEVTEQLQSWGVFPVKNIELMDIRDSKSSNVIQNIMEKKKSFIEMESRQAVAENKKKAEIAEIESQREVDLQKQEATRQVGTKQAETERLVALANEQKKQEISETAKITTEKEMQVIKVKEIKQAEISKEVEIVNANKLKEKMILEAEARLEESRRAAEGVAVMGEAAANAEKAKLLAPVEAQVRLAQEIGNNKGYQEYLVSLEQIKAQESVGVKQAEALTAADIKIIANSGNAGSGIKSVTDILSSQGGTQIGAMIEGLSNLDGGQALLRKLGLMKENNDLM